MSDRVRLPIVEELRRPRTRGSCADVPRPCPWASCRYSLLIDVLPDGRVLELRDLDADDDRPTCALDVAEEGGVSFDTYGPWMTRTGSALGLERFERHALARFRAALARELGRAHDDIEDLRRDLVAA